MTIIELEQSIGGGAVLVTEGVRVLNIKDEDTNIVHLIQSYYIFSITSRKTFTSGFVLQIHRLRINFNISVLVRILKNSP